MIDVGLLAAVFAVAAYGPDRPRGFRRCGAGFYGSMSCRASLWGLWRTRDISPRTLDIADLNVFLQRLGLGEATMSDGATVPQCHSATVPQCHGRSHSAILPAVQVAEAAVVGPTALVVQDEQVSTGTR